MSDETLRGWLKRLESPNEPGGWAVRWVQGAVAAGAQQVKFYFRRGAMEAEIHGTFSTSSSLLAEQFVRGRIPTIPWDRHWVTALDGLEEFPGKLRLVSRQGETREVVHIEQGTVQQVKQEKLQGDAPSLVLVVEPDKSGSPLASPWEAERRVLRSRLRFCPVPVYLGRQLISQRPVFKDSRALMNWMEQAMGNERFFTMQGDPKQILSPALVSPKGFLVVPQRCSLMVTLSRAAPGTGQARAYWLRDGALSGPVRVVGPTGNVRVDILCPGDRPGLELREWYERDPSSLFPSALVLSVARRLAGGLDSMAQEALVSDRPIDQIIRKANSVPALTRVMPTLGRPYNALGGAFHQAVKAFSLRPHLELVPG